MNRRTFVVRLGGGLLATSIHPFLKPPEVSADVLIIGGGVGGCAAALAAARNGLRVVMTDRERSRISLAAAHAAVTCPLFRRSALLSIPASCAA